MKEDKQNKKEVVGIVNTKIVQLLIAPNDETWQGVILGLGDDGVTYSVGQSGKWESYIPPVGYNSNEME